MTLGSDPAEFRTGMAEAAAGARAKPRTRDSRRGSLALMRVLSAMGAEQGSVRNHMPSLADLSKAVAGYEFANGGLTVAEARNIRAFIGTLEQFGFSIPSDRVASGKVRIMTIWRAKGLEFPVVFAPKLSKKHVQGDQNYLGGAQYPAKRYRGGTDYDRRMLYTAITRSQKYLILTDPDPARQEFMPEMGGGLFSVNLPAGDDAGESPREPISHLAYEEVEVYARCPHEYYLRHVLEYREGLKPESDYTENVLAMLDVIHAGGRSGRVPSESEIGVMADVMFHMRLASRPEESNLRKKTVGRLSRYTEKSRGTVLGNAGSSVKTVHGFGGSSVTGTADLVGGDGRVMLFEPKRGAEREHGRPRGPRRVLRNIGRVKQGIRALSVIWAQPQGGGRGRAGGDIGGRIRDQRPGLCGDPREGKVRKMRLCPRMRPQGVGAGRPRVMPGGGAPDARPCRTRRGA